jgi:hypothetical protein
VTITRKVVKFVIYAEGKSELCKIGKVFRFGGDGARWRTMESDGVSASF